MQPEDKSKVQITLPPATTPFDKAAMATTKVAIGGFFFLVWFFVACFVALVVVLLVASC